MQAHPASVYIEAGYVVLGTILISDQIPRTATDVAVDLSPRQMTEVLGDAHVFAELLELSLESEVRFDTLASLPQPEPAMVRIVKSKYAYFCALIGASFQ